MGHPKPRKEKPTPKRRKKPKWRGGMRPSGEGSAAGGGRGRASQRTGQQEARACAHGRRLACFRPRRRFRVASASAEEEEEGDTGREKPTARARRLSLGGGSESASPRLALACSCEYQTLQCLVTGGENAKEAPSTATTHAATSLAEDLYLYRQRKWSERFAARDWQQERVCQKWKENQKRFVLQQQLESQAQVEIEVPSTEQEDTPSRLSPPKFTGNAVKQAFSNLTSAAEALLHSRQFDALLRAGIPPPLRGQVWWMCSGAAELKQSASESYPQLIQRLHTLSKCAEMDIEKDLPRTFPAALRDSMRSSCGPSSGAFGPRGDDKFGELRRVLQAYSLRNPAIGYCQSMNFLAAVLLHHLEEEEAFWVLTAIVEELTPQFHTRTMTGSRAEQRVFADLVAQKLPELARHLQTLGVDLEPFTLKWFLCLFLNTLPFEPVLRIWDVFFCEGSHVLLRVGLALLKLNMPRVLACDDALDVYEMFKLSHETLRELTAPYRTGLLNRDECVCDTLLRLAMDKSYLGAIPFDSLHELRQFYCNEIELELEEVEERRRQRAAAQASSTVSLELAEKVVDAQEETETSCSSSNGEDQALLLEYDFVDDYAAVTSGSESELELSPSRHIHFLDLYDTGDAPADYFVDVLYDLSP